MDADDVTLLGTAAQMALGFTGLDLAADIRDLIYDLTHWQWTWGHAGQTALDGIGLVPVIGLLKNADEVGDLGRAALRQGDEAGGVVRHVDEVVEGAGSRIKTNLGNEIDVTPSANHSTVTKNPGLKGAPNSSVDILDDTGNIKIRRWFDFNGDQIRDVDFTNHGNPTSHPEWPHEHGQRK